MSAKSEITDFMTSRKNKKLQINRILILSVVLEACETSSIS
jgi:hypothetical protein